MKISWQSAIVTYLKKANGAVKSRKHGCEHGAAARLVRLAALQHHAGSVWRILKVSI